MKKVFPLFLIVLTAFCSCDDNTFYLPKSEKPRFDEGDTFYYYSEQTHLTDTLYVNYMYHGFEHCDEEEYENVTYECYVKTNMSDRKSFKFNYTYSLLGNMKIYTCRIDGSRLYYSRFMQENGQIEIDGRNYDYDIIYPDETNVENLPTSIFISYTCGIMGYTYSDSITYIITNPIK